MEALSNCLHAVCSLLVGDAGRHNDSGIFANCSFGQALIDEKLNIPDDRALPGLCPKIYIIM